MRLSRESRAKQVHAAAPLAGHDHPLVGELPGIRDARQQRHAALVAVEQVDLALLGQPLELGQALALEPGHVRVGPVLYLPSNSLEAAAVFFRNRRRVSCENVLPSSCSSSALARLTRWRLFCTARRTAARSVSFFRIACRPCPALVFSPSRPCAPIPLEPGVDDHLAAADLSGDVLRGAGLGFEQDHPAALAVLVGLAVPTSFLQGSPRVSAEFDAFDLCHDLF